MKFLALTITITLWTFNGIAAETTLINRNSQGGHTGNSTYPAISSDGKTVIFTSSAADLVPPGLDTNGVDDIFAFDKEQRRISLVSVNSSGEQANAESKFASVSADGRFVTFSSAADNLTTASTGGFSQVYLHDRLIGSTTLVSRSLTGAAGNANSLFSSVSDDGRYIVFDSRATDLVSGDTNGAEDVFLFDRVSFSMSRVSVSTAGVQGNSLSHRPVISGNGQVVAFQSPATNFVPTGVDDNDDWDVFKHFIATGVTVPVSAIPTHTLSIVTGIQTTYEMGDDGSFEPSISEDGSSIAFVTYAPSLHGQQFFGIEVMKQQLSRSPKLMSKDAQGRGGDEGSSRPSISSDGRYIYFETSARNLVPNESGRNLKRVVLDTDTGVIERVDVNTSGNAGTNNSLSQSLGGAQRQISADGKTIAFHVGKDLLVTDDSDELEDIFLRERGEECTPTTPGATKSLPPNQWLLAALPCSPLPYANTVEDLFADDIEGALGDTWALFTFDATAANPVTEAATLSTTLQPGQGFWIIQDTGTTVTLDMPTGSREVTGRRTAPETACLSSAGCFELPLSGAPNTDFLWNMIGNPFPGTNSVAFNDLRVSTTVGACAGPSGCTMTEAASPSAEVVADVFFHYNGTGYITRGPGSTLAPWEGYWVPELRLSDFNSPLIRFPR